MKYKAESTPATPSGVAIFPSPKVKYLVTIFCALYQISTSLEVTDVELDEFVRTTLRDGYVDSEFKETTIYPGHTINKIVLKAL